MKTQTKDAQKPGTSTQSDKHEKGQDQGDFITPKKDSKNKTIVKNTRNTDGQ